MKKIVLVMCGSLLIANVVFASEGPGPGAEAKFLKPVVSKVSCICQKSSFRDLPALEQRALLRGGK